MNIGSRSEHRSSDPAAIGNESVHLADIPADLVAHDQRYPTERFTERFTSAPRWSEAAAPSASRYQSQHQSQRVGWVDLFLTLERPQPDRLAGIDRGERYRLLMADAWEQRHRIEHWAKEMGLCDEIMHFGEPNSFHVLFVRCTPDAARQFVCAPGVIDVAISQID